MKQIKWVNGMARGLVEVPYGGFHYLRFGGSWYCFRSHRALRRYANDRVHGELARNFDNKVDDAEVLRVLNSVYSKLVSKKVRKS